MSRLATKNPNRAFMVPVHKRMEYGENEEIQRLKDNYDAHSEAVFDYLAALHGERSDNAEATRQEAAAEEAEHRRLMALNEAENQRVLELRKQSEAAELHRRVQRLMERKERNEQRAANTRAAALRLLQDTEEFVKNFIPPEDFEKVLSESYDNPVNYDFAITLDGKVLRGSSSQPSAEEAHVASLPREPASPFSEARRMNKSLPRVEPWTCDPPKEVPGEPSQAQA